VKVEPRKDAPAQSSRKASAKPRRAAGLRVLADVTAISADTEDLHDRLQRFVDLIARVSETDV